MSYEISISKGLSVILIISFVCSWVIEFKLDKMIIHSWPIFLQGHRAFIVNLLLGIFGSVSITCLLNYMSYRRHFINAQEKIDDVLYELFYTVKKLSNVNENDREQIWIYIRKIEDVYNIFEKAYDKMGCTLPRYEDVEEKYRNLTFIRDINAYINIPNLQEDVKSLLRSIATAGGIYMEEENVKNEKGFLL